MADLSYVPKCKDLQDVVYFPVEEEPELCAGIIDRLIKQGEKKK